MFLFEMAFEVVAFVYQLKCFFFTLKIFDLEEGSRSHPSVFEDQGNALGKTCIETIASEVKF